MAFVRCAESIAIDVCLRFAARLRLRLFFVRRFGTNLPLQHGVLLCRFLHGSQARPVDLLPFGTRHRGLRRWPVSGTHRAGTGSVAFGVFLAWAVWRHHQSNVPHERPASEPPAEVRQRSALTLQLLATGSILLSFAVHPLSADYSPLIPPHAPPPCLQRQIMA